MQPYFPPSENAYHWEAWKARVAETGSLGKDQSLLPAPPYGKRSQWCRFSEVFGRDEASLPRRWGPRENITAVMHKAYQEVAVLLAQIAVIRLDKSQVGSRTI